VLFKQQTVTKTGKLLKKTAAGILLACFLKKYKTK
jgi:hypothetical protein